MLIAAAVLTAALTVGTPITPIPPAPAVGIDQIAQCESRGNPRAHNPHSSAAGLYQMLTTTWLSNGGSRYAPTADRATPAQQRDIAQKLFARRGSQPWAASRSCWSGSQHAVTRRAHGRSRTLLGR